MVLSKQQMGAMTATGVKLARAAGTVLFSKFEVAVGSSTSISLTYQEMLHWLNYVAMATHIATKLFGCVLINAIRL